MSGLTLFPEQARHEIGVEKECPETIEIEKGAIRKYAEAILDPNPLYRDVDFARHRGFESVLAPPLFLRGVPPHDLLPPIPEGLTGVHGSDEWELLLPVQAGDVISCKGKLTDITEKVGRSGRLAFLSMEVSFANQRGEKVANYRTTVIFRPKPEGR